MKARVDKSILLNDHSGYILPHAPEAEESLIGSLTSPAGARILDEVSTDLAPEMIYDIQRSIIYSAILALRQENKPIDFSLVLDKISQMGKGDEVPRNIIAQLFARGYDLHHAELHALIIKQKYLQRKTIELSQTLNQQAFDDTQDIGDVLFAAGNQIEQLQGSLIGTSGIKSIKEVAHSSYSEIDRKVGLFASGKQTGITTGLCDLNTSTTGWKGGELIILAARPAMGKTAVALHMAKSASKEGTPVVIFSLEMDGNSLFERLIASECSVHPSKLKSGNLSADEINSIGTASGILYNLPVHIDDNSSVNMGYIRSVSRLLHRQGKCGMIVIDYLQLISESGASNRNREQEISRMSREAKIIAKELNIPVILLSQLNREVDKRPDKKPILADLRESGSIEQDADMVIFVHRPEYYGIEVQDNGHTVSNYGELLICKHRNGQTGKVKFKHNGTLTKIFDYDTRGYSDVVPDDKPF